MSTWTDRIPVAWPESMLADANALAAIIDPDTGGALTFGPAQTRGGLTANKTVTVTGRARLYV